MEKELENLTADPAENNGNMPEGRFIVFDLEWNQSADGKNGAVPGLPFEIIEIGAVKLDRNRRVLDTFSRIVRPSVYPRLHYKVLEITHFGMDELRKRGEPFSKVIRDFLDWSFEPGTRPVFCTYGSMDLMELQRNIAYFGVEDPFPYPFLYYDVQKLFSLLYEENRKDRPPLEKAAEHFGIPMDRPFHRALDDAVYTAKVLEALDFDRAAAYLSLDYYRLPKTREEEIYLVFPDYSKYVSRLFPSRDDALRDRTVMDMVCYRCNRMLRKKIRWFSPNSHQFLCLACCPEHGFVKGKLRLKRAENGKVFAVKTIKLISEEGAAAIEKKREETAAHHAVRNRKRHMKEKNRRKE